MIMKIKSSGSLLLTSDNHGIWLDYQTKDGDKSHLLIYENSDPEPLKLEVEIEELESKIAPVYPDIIIES